MKKKEARELDNGLYRLYWKDGGSSLAAVGTLHNGDKWFAPTSWVSIGSTNWRLVLRVELLVPFGFNCLLQSSRF